MLKPFRKLYMTILKNTYCVVIENATIGEVCDLTRIHKLHHILFIGKDQGPPPQRMCGTLVSIVSQLCSVPVRK